MSYTYMTGQWPAIQRVINHNHSSTHPAVNKKKPHNSKSAYVSKICYTLKCRLRRHLSNGTWTRALARQLAVLWSDWRHSLLLPLLITSSCKILSLSLFDSRRTVAWPPTTSAWPISDFFQNVPNCLKRPKNVVWQSANGVVTSDHFRVTVQWLFSKSS